MKKVLFRLVSATILVLTIFVIGSVKVEAQATTSPSITVTSPINGGVYKAGDVVQIKWLSSNIPSGANIGISYITGADEYGYSVDANYLTASSTQFNWFIRSSDIIHGPIKAGTLYKIKVYAYKDGKILASGISGNIEFLPLGPVELEASTLSTREDRAGGFDQFEPGGAPNWNWQINLKYPATTTIQNILIFRNYVDEKWSTNGLYMGRKTFPIVVYKDGKQVNSKYGDLNIPVIAGVTKLNLYGQSASQDFDNATIVVYYGGGRSINTQLPAYIPSAPPATSAPTISGLTAPTVLSVGQMGTWTVKVSDQNNGSLSYSVKWGDEGRVRLAGSEPFVQTSTFTHTYSVAGTYKPTFTVKNEAGLSAETSATVQVGSSINCYTFTTNLTIGSTGADVVALQDLLIAKGFGIVKIQTGETPKGYFGEDTKNAVLLYQKSIGIEATGFVGPLTRASLNADSCNSSNGVTVSGAIANVGSPIISNDRNVAYPASFKFTLNNLKDNAVYIYKDLSKFLRLNEKGGPSDVKIDIIVASPSMLAGDSEKVIIIPAGASRTFTINAILRDFSDEEKTELKVVKIVGLSYFDSLNSQNPNVIEKGLENLSLSIAMDSIKIPPSPSLSVLSPVGERTYKFGSTIQIAWNAQSVDADYYYALLENTAIQNLGVVVTGNLPTTSTSTSFVFSKNVLDTFIANGGGLTEEQLRNRYYIRVIGMKRGAPYNRAVVNNVSGVFSVSTIESSKGITVSGTKATLGSPVESKDEVIAYPISFTFTLNNQKNEDIYVPKVARNILALNADNKPSTVEFSEVFASSPAILAGDAEKVFVVPSGASRTFTIYGNINNNGGTSGLKDIRVTSISYINFGKNPDSGVVKEGLEKLRLNVLMIGTTENNKLVIRDASARLGTAIYRGNDAYGYNYEMSLIVSNPGKSDVYMSNKDDGADLNAVITPDVASVKYVKTWSPSTLAGDTSGAVIIPSGSSRAMKISGQLINMGKPTLVNYRITSLNYGTSSSNPRALSITTGLENLKVSATFGGGSIEKPFIKVLSPTGGTYKVGNSMQILWNTKDIPSNQDLDISLYLDTRGIGKPIATVKNTGSYTWRVKDVEPFYDSESRKMIYPNGTYKIVISCPIHSAICSSMIPNFGESALFAIASSTATPPTITRTPIPAVNASLSASLLTTNIDRAGMWNVFAPGSGAGGQGTTDPADWNWSATLNLATEKKISSVTIRQTNGEYWSTDNTTYFPLVIVDSSGRQLNSQYSDDLGSFRSGQYKWTLYGQKNTPTWVGGYVTVVFSDGTKVSADISIPAPVACPVGYICNPVNSSSSYCPTGYVCNSVTTNCPAGYTCTTKILKSSLATPVPTLYYSPSPTPYYYSTPIPTPVPTATATPAPTATPYITPSPTPTPSSAPVTTSTPSPSSTPYSTPRPSTSPSPSSSPSAMNAEYDRLQASIWQAVAEWFMGR